MSRAVVEVERALNRSGLLRQGVAVALACTSPGTGRLTWVGGELTGGEAVTADATMYAASVTKQLVAALAAQQVLAAHLDPDATIADHLPALPAWARAIRVRHLIHHTSGLPSTNRVLTAAGLSTEQGLDNALVLHGLSRLSAPDWPPGQRFVYSNIGYVVLAEVLRAGTGTPLPDLARQSVFAPLGMSGSRLTPTAEQAMPDETRPPRTLGDGGLWTSAVDLLTWLSALNSDRLGADLTRLIQTRGQLDDSTSLDYAWGVIARSSPGGTSYTHGGNWTGWSAKTIRRPATATAVALLSTSNDVQAVSQAAVDLHDQLPVS